MRVYADRSINFSNEYEIEPLQPGKQKTKWISHSAAMGHMHGTFKISDDQLVSEYKSAKNNYRGCERFTYQNDDQYKVEGELIKGGKTVSTWSVVLQRQRSAVSGSKH